MPAALLSLLAFLRAFTRSRLDLQLEVLALRHQLAVATRGAPRPRFQPSDRLLWSLLSRLWQPWRAALVLVRPETVIRWQRRRFRDHWLRKCKAGRPRVHPELRDLIRTMAAANTLWGSPRIQGELRHLGINLSRSTIERYMQRPHPAGERGQSWSTFLKNHLAETLAIDFFVVPTIRNRVLYVFLVLDLERRQLRHFNITANPTAAWTAQQLREALPWSTGKQLLLRDRDKIYSPPFQATIQALGLQDTLTAPRSPWQNPYVERLIGTIRRDCLDHTIILNAPHLKRTLTHYFTYYHHWRTHLALDMQTPEPRPITADTNQPIQKQPHLGGLHHHYTRNPR